MNKFGFWFEDGRGYEDYPSIKNYLRERPMPDYAKIVSFLNGGTVGIIGGFPVYSIIDKTMISSSKVILNDDLWVWPEDLSHYVTNHNLHISDEFLKHIRKQEYRCKKVPSDTYSKFLSKQIEG